MRKPTPPCPSCAVAPAPAASATRLVAQPGKKALLNRVRRIEGQIGGVIGMIEQDRYCVDIITQVSAIKSALDGVAVQILSAHASGCVRRAVRETGGDAEIEELLGVVRKLMR